MGKIAIIIQVVLIATSANCQNYESLFGIESTQWNITIGNLWGIGSTEHNIIGDTIIDNQTYRMINGYEGSNDIIGYLRQDSLSEKAWYRNNLSTDEILIMDLSLEVGDSLYIQGVWNSNHQFYTVDSTYLKDGLKHIQFNLPINNPLIQFNDKFTLIEGIVSNMGFRYQDNDYINGFPTILLCAFQNDDKIYGDECIINSVESISSMQHDIKIYPNPAYNKLVVESLKSRINGVINIIDSYGQVHYTFRGMINDKFVDISELNSGIYFIAIQNLDTMEQFCKKIIKVTNNR